MNQIETIKRHMQIHDSITSRDAIELGITRLASVIGKLEKQGEMINHVSETVEGKFGKCNVTRYSLVRMQDNQAVML